MDDLIGRIRKRQAEAEQATARLSRGYTLCAENAEKAAHHANLALDLREAADALERLRQLPRYNCDCLPAGPHGEPSDDDDAVYCERWLESARRTCARLREEPTDDARPIR
jgi:hypothetical protein